MKRAEWTGPTRMNSVFQCLDQAIGHAFRRCLWETVLGERFVEIEPWLLPAPHRAERVTCEQGNGGHCSYRVVEHEDGRLVGVCDEGRCPRRSFEAEELVQYAPNFSRLRGELARLLELEPDRSEPPHANVLPVGSLLVDGGRIAVKLVGGLNPSALPAVLMQHLDVRGPGQIILLASSYGDKTTLRDFIHRSGWFQYDIEEAFILQPRRLAWEDGARQRWLHFRETVLSRGPSSGHGTQPIIRAVKRGFADLGKDISGYRDEIESLRAGLSEQLRRIGNEVEPEFFQMILALLVNGSVRSAAEKLGTSKSTLDRRLKEYLTRGGLYETLHGMLAVRSRRLGSRKLESFNETYAKHQVNGQTSDRAAIIEELVQAMEEADPDIWPEVLSEFSDSLRGSS